MSVYNYQNVLGIDRDSYEQWSNQIDAIERRAISQLRAVVPDFDFTKSNQLVFDYCTDLVVLTLFGDSMSTGLQDFRRQDMALIIGRIKYTNTWREEVADVGES